METTRQYIQKLLERSIGGKTVDEIASHVEQETETENISPSDVLSHLEHIKKSLEHTDKQILGTPPQCQDCGFEDFDTILNNPSRCPNCKSEFLTQPKFKIE